MNISITNECNRRCEYCFQKKWYLAKELDTKKEMTVEEFENNIVKFVGDNNYCNVMGGEPLLHSNIKGILDVCKNHNIKVSLLSNISIDTDIFSDILDYMKVNEIGHTWLINADYTESQKETFIKNYIKIMSEDKIFDDSRLSISTTFIQNREANISKVDRILELYKISKEYDMKVGIRTTPMTYNHSDSYIMDYDYTYEYMYLFKNLFEFDKNALFNFDCDVYKLPCKINDKLFEILGKRIPYFSDVERTPCEAPVDFLVDGSAVYGSCSTFIKLSKEEIDSFTNPEQIFSSLEEKKNIYWSLYPMNKKCQECFKYKYKLCAGMTCIAENNYLCMKYNQKHKKQIYELSED